MQDGELWWYRYGRYTPGPYNSPHMGEVLADYRRRRYWTQQAFAEAIGVSWRTVREWEMSDVISDTGRRIFLAKVLRIPPVLLGLTWYQVYGEQEPQGYEEGLLSAAERMEADSYYHYEDTLALGWELFYEGRLLVVADRMERRLRKLEGIVERVPVGPEQEAWRELLGRYYLLAVQIERHRGQEGSHRQGALRYNAQALRLAQMLDLPALQAHALSMRADVQHEQGRHGLARQLALASLQHLDQAQPPLQGNLLLMAAATVAAAGVADEQDERQVRRWQEQALTLVYKRRIEPDGSFLKLNLAGVHHDRAKLLLLLARQRQRPELLREARQELLAAWKQFTPELRVWQVHFALTEAELELAAGEVEGSARAALQALEAARQMGSRKYEGELKRLYGRLRQVAGPRLPPVERLGIALGCYE
ncbi:helix-turn-helix domain-containing protein [Thermogemmatispora carboxidivorans]|uniref:helix-turn-helix domain-containing protein n=1 Tax=Thermogemmatispora carboxidivorans TaxID=1382306 RepID=UPI00069B25CD|nr:helix-turn-helix transcriptional regulator [Thermogemmatispora carboxidivorans]